MDAWRQKIDMELDLRLLILMELDLWFVIRKNILLMVFGISMVPSGFWCEEKKCTVGRVR